MLESGGEAASTKMTELLEDKEIAYRFEGAEFLRIADRLAELDKVDEACQVLTAFASHFAETPEIRQKLDAYCEGL
jgi:hypothetical protein